MSFSDSSWSPNQLLKCTRGEQNFSRLQTASAAGELRCDTISSIAASDHQEAVGGSSVTGHNCRAAVTELLLLPQPLNEEQKCELTIEYDVHSLSTMDHCASILGCADEMLVDQALQQASLPPPAVGNELLELTLITMALASSVQTGKDSTIAAEPSTHDVASWMAAEDVEKVVRRRRRYASLQVLEQKQQQQTPVDSLSDDDDVREKWGRIRLPYSPRETELVYDILLDAPICVPPKISLGTSATIFPIPTAGVCN